MEKTPEAMSRLQKFRDGLRTGTRSGNEAGGRMMIQLRDYIYGVIKEYNMHLNVSHSFPLVVGE